LVERGLRWVTDTVWHPHAQDYVFRSSQIRSRPVRAIGRTGLSCGYYVGSQMVLDAAWDYDLVEAQARYAIDYLPAVKDFLQNCPGVIKVEEYVDHILAVHYSHLELARKALSESPLARQHTYSQCPPDADCLLVFPAHMSKAVALRRVQRELRIDARETLVAVDGTNDLPLLSPEIAAWQVAPSNAIAEVKERIERNRGVVSSQPYSDGVIDGIRSLLMRAGVPPE
jgi:hypothetical protein